MNNFHALILGSLQGLTEILPISSSAHLILIPKVLGWPASGLTFDVALHLGTLVALTLYFWRDILDLSYNFIGSMTGKGLQTAGNRLPWFIVIATIPAALAGKTLEEPIEEIFRHSPTTICAFLIGFALLLAFADTTGAKHWKLDRITLKSALFIGIAQCLALIPGVSRSGVTITAALLLGYNRETSARFSFLLSLPIVFGAAVLKVGHLFKTGVPPGESVPLLLGVTSSALFGYLGVSVLLKLVQRHSLYPFVWYRLVAGTIFLLLL
jgi:undecaprenyl-diphosphatase